MKLPINTESMAFMCASIPEPVLDFDTKQQKADGNGEPLYGLQVVVITDSGAEVINVKTTNKPAVEAGQTLVLHDLLAIPWSMGDRSGVAFRAGAIEAAGSARKSKEV